MLATQQPEPMAHYALYSLGQTLKMARKQRGVTGRDLAEKIGLSPRTLIKIEQGDESVVIGSYIAAAIELGLTWPFEVFKQDCSATDAIPKHYLTGATALSIPRQSDQIPALWYTSSVADPESWQIAGRDIASTHHLIGALGLWDATQTIAKYGVALPRVWAASHERALFDLLIYNCEVKAGPVPNIQLSDIDDVVNLEQVKRWIDDCRAFITPDGLRRIEAWLDGGY